MDKTHPSMVRPITVASFMLITAATMFFILRGVTSAAVPNTIDASKASPPIAPAAGCWLTVPSPNPANSSSQLLGITAVSASDVWAVGYSMVTTNTSRTLIEHWDGSSWSIVQSPNPDASYNWLFGIDSLASDNVWAVGGAGVHSHPLVLRWNGTQWNVLPSPALNGQLSSVTVISTDDVWAVGFGIIIHWNGTHWSTATDPNGAYLYGVDGIASNDVWAASDTYPLHWDGAHWNAVPIPDPPTISCFLHLGFMQSVSMVSHNDVWFVGYCPGREPGTVYPLTLHWDGSNWTYYPVDINPFDTPNLLSVHAIASNDVWAVGVLYTSYTNHLPQTLAIHWDGTQWTQIPTPNPGAGYDSLAGVAATPQGDVWAVGSYRDSASGPSSTLAQRYYPSCPITPTPTPTPTLVPPPCPNERFTDVCPTDYFYTSTLALADDSILSGYNTSPPCRNDLWIPCFNPYSSSTRGQISKVVSLAAGFNEPVSGQIFEDVPLGSTFYTHTERMAERGIISGYSCGGPGEPCVPPDNRPYFRTNNYVTRGQLSKMVSLAFGWNDPPVGQDFEDIPPGSTFYTYVAQLHNRSIIQGYLCGGSGEPCVPPDNLPYFRPNNDVTRGQTAKIVQLARSQPNPTPTVTATATLTAVVTMTATSVATSTPPVPTDTPAPTVTSATTSTSTQAESIR